MNLPVFRTVFPAAVFAELALAARDEQEMREEALAHLFDCFIPEKRAAWLKEQRDLERLDADAIDNHGSGGFAADSGGDW